MDYNWEYRYNIDRQGTAVEKIGPECKKQECEKDQLDNDLMT